MKNPKTSNIKTNDWVKLKPSQIRTTMPAIIDTIPVIPKKPKPGIKTSTIKNTSPKHNNSAGIQHISVKISANSILSPCIRIIQPKYALVNTLF